MTDNPITLAGDLGKPANTFIEKISDAVVGIFRPYQMKRVTKAEIETKTMKALADIEIGELQQRAIARFAVEETNKQANMESIAHKALAGLTEDAQPDQMDNDWITDFFDKCRLVSDEQMQELWAKLLAGEANKPGSYSKRVVAAVSTLSKSEAELFTVLCSFGWTMATTDTQLQPLIYAVPSKIYDSHGLTFEALTNLDSIGLILFETAGLYHTELPEQITISYHGDSVDLLLLATGANDDYTISLGLVILTQVGTELAAVCNPRPVEGFKDYVLDYWKKIGYTIVGDDPDTTTD